MKKIILIGCLALIGLGCYGASEISNMQNKNNVQKKYEEEGEKHVEWKEGFTKTKGMIYVPESYEVAYTTLVDIYNERKEKEGLQGNVEELFYKEADLIKLIREQNKTRLQDYPSGTMLSPSVDLIGSGGYYNNIIFIPNKVLTDYKDGFNLIHEQIDTYEEDSEKADKNLIEVMEINCSINQLPRNIDVFYYPRDILRLWQPTLKIDANNQTLEVLNDGEYKSYLYVFEKDGNITVSHDDIFVEESNNPPIPINNIEKIVYLFFLPDFISDNPSDPFASGTSFYWPKMVIYNIENPK